MADFKEHLDNYLKSDALALIEDPSGKIKSAISLVQHFITDKVQGMEAEVRAESLKGAANQVRISILQALCQEYTSFSEQLSNLHILDHSHSQAEQEAANVIEPAPVVVEAVTEGPKVVEQPGETKAVIAPPPLVVTETSTNG